MDADLETVSLDVLNIVFCFRDVNGLECLEVYPWRSKVYSIRFDFGGSVSEGSSNNTEDSSLVVYLFPRNLSPLQLFAFIE